MTVAAKADTKFGLQICSDLRLFFLLPQKETCPNVWQTEKVFSSALMCRTNSRNRFAAELPPSIAHFHRKLPGYSLRPYMERGSLPGVWIAARAPLFLAAAQPIRCRVGVRKICPSSPGMARKSKNAHDLGLRLPEGWGGRFSFRPACLVKFWR